MSIPTQEDAWECCRRWHEEKNARDRRSKSDAPKPCMAVQTAFVKCSRGCLLGGRWDFPFYKIPNLSATAQSIEDLRFNRVKIIRSCRLRPVPPSQPCLFPFRSDETAAVRLDLECIPG